jgi:hypothetical protein
VKAPAPTPSRLSLAPPSTSHTATRVRTSARQRFLRGPLATALLTAAIALTAAAWLPSSAEAAGPPQVGPAWTTDVTASSATLHAEVNPNGFTTTYRFQYLTEVAYQANLSAGREAFTGAAQAPAGAEAGLGSASTDQPAQQHIQGLQPSTAYRYRILAASECEPPGPRCIAEGLTPSFTTEETAPVFALPDARGWELVSPVDKNGGAIQGFGGNHGGGVLQAAAQGGAVTYSSASSFGAGAQGAPAASQNISRRGEGGWSTENITAPALSGSYGEHPDGVPYQLFSTDLSSGLLLNGEHCRVEGEECPVANPPLSGSEAPVGYQNYYLRDEGGGFQALLTESNAELGPSAKQFDLAFAGASPDLRHVVLSTCAALTPAATEVPSGGGGCNPAETNLYEWSGGALSLINEPASHHAALAAQSGAISTDGRRVYFTAGEDSPIFLREEGQPAKVIAKTVGGVGAFQTASADGSLAFFTAGGDLYRYDALTEATSEPLAEEVVGVLGASEDGSSVYYLTSAGLFLWQASATTTTEIAPGAPAAFAGDYPPATGTARVSPDGPHLAFLSAASLTGYDNADAITDEPDSELYLYTAPAGSGDGTLACASCNPTGERPVGSATIPRASRNGKSPTATDSYKPRDLSANGTRLFFDSRDSLVLQDTNSAPDVYEWEAQGAGTCQRPGGCVNLISSGRSAAGASFVDASANGADAFFLTDASLVPSDPGSVDLYDAREGGGFAVPPTPTECDGDACQSLPPEPEDPTPGTLVPGAPNPPVHFPKQKKHHHKKHHHKHRAGSHR